MSSADPVVSVGFLGRERPESQSVNVRECQMYRDKLPVNLVYALPVKSSGQQWASLCQPLRRRRYQVTLPPRSGIDRFL